MAGGDWKDMFLGVQKNDFELVRYHILMGIDLNYQHPEFLTSALIESIRLKHWEMMKYLLDNGAKPDIREAESCLLPLEIAKLLGDGKACKILQEYLKDI